MSVTCLSIKFPLPPPTSLYNFNSPPKFSPHNQLHLRSQPSICKRTSTSSFLNFIYPLEKPSNSNLHAGGGGGNKNNNNNNNGGGNGNRWWKWWSDDDDYQRGPDSNWIRNILLVAIPLLALPAVAVTLTSDGVWEIRGGKRTRLVPNIDYTSFIPIDSDANQKNGQNLILGFQNCISGIRDLFLNLMLPEGYPTSVSSDYMQYSLWRGLQGIASQISGVLATQSLLYAVGLGKGVIPTAAAVNWVLKDGIGYLSKIFLSNFGRHFDVNPKGWRLFADLLENAAFRLEILTPSFPQHFLMIGAAFGAGRSAAILIQEATRSCFFVGFALQRNSAEVIAKGEAQGMVSKFIGITIGIGLANYVGSSTPLALAVFTAVAGFHMYCNIRSYQSIQLRTLNPYRGSLVFSEYLISGLVPRIKDVNAEEPFYPGLLLPFDDTCMEQVGTLTGEARNAAAEICSRLKIGCKLSELVKNKEDAFALFELFKDERYIVMENGGKFCVVLKEGCSPQDMLKSLFHVNYLYWLEKNVQMEPTSVADECKHGGKLCMSLEYVQREFGHVRRDGLESGWLVNDGLIARPLPYRIRIGYAESVEPRS